MRAESASVRVLGKCPAFEAVVMAARVVVMRAPLPNQRNNDKSRRTVSLPRLARIVSLVRLGIEFPRP